MVVSSFPFSILGTHRKNQCKRMLPFKLEVNEEGEGWVAGGEQEEDGWGAGGEKKGWSAGNEKEGSCWCWR